MNTKVTLLLLLMMLGNCGNFHLRSRVFNILTILLLSIYCQETAQVTVPIQADYKPAHAQYIILISYIPRIYTNHTLWNSLLSPGCFLSLSPPLHTPPITVLASPPMVMGMWACASTPKSVPMQAEPIVLVTARMILRTLGAAPSRAVTIIGAIVIGRMSAFCKQSQVSHSQWIMPYL